MESDEDNLFDNLFTGINLRYMRFQILLYL